mmetsp:Transcript_16421/g.49431  ORF Transcript_16421/g.49431 Transcript_16421/m.49431 type:complete len:212 (-) Transcript_16421:61-696(-)
MPRFAKVFVVLLGSAAALRGPDARAEADEVRAMMESVRVKTEGGDAKPLVSAVAKKAPVAGGRGERFPGLDKDLMERADRVAEEMREMNEPSPAPKKALLASKSQESRQERAARFFATHGMKGVGSMLGDSLSADAEAAALKEQDESKRMVQQAMSETGIKIPKSSSGSSSRSASTESFDAIDDMQDEEDAAAQARWKAVDALRRKRPSFA